MPVSDSVIDLTMDSSDTEEENQSVIILDDTNDTSSPMKQER